MAELWASWHELAREEAESIFGTSHRKAGGPAKFKQQTIGKIASEEKPILLQKEDLWRAVCRRTNEVNVCRLASTSDSSLQLKQVWGATLKI